MTAEKLRNPGIRDEVAEDTQDDELRIDLVEIFFRLLEKAWLIILVGALVATASGLYTYFFVEDTYEATTKLYVIGDDTAIDLTQLNFGDKLADDYIQVFYNRDVHRAVKESLQSKYGYTLPDFATMQRTLHVSQLSNTRILKIAYADPSREMALCVVEEYANVACEFIQARMGAQVPPTEFETPYASMAPLGTGLARNAVFGFLIGVLAVSAILVIIFITDDRIRTSEQLERALGLPTLGVMPLQKSQSRSRRKGRDAE